MKETQQQKEIVASLDVGQRNKDCRRQTESETERLRAYVCRIIKKDSEKNEDVKRGKARKKGENLSVSLSPRLSH